MKRREFLKTSGAAIAGGAILSTAGGIASSCAAHGCVLYRLSPGITGEKLEGLYRQ